MIFSIPTPVIPTDEEMIISAKKWYSSLKPHVFNNWCRELVDITLPFSRAEIDGTVAINVYDCKTEGFNEILKGVEQAISSIDSKEGFFIKLDSRSPKDACKADKFGKPLPFMTAEEAASAIASSERCLDDMCLLMRLGPVGIVARPFIKWNPWDEWRVLVGDGKVSISQYYYHSVFEELLCDNSAKEKVIRDFIDNKVRPHIGVDEFVADVVFIDNKIWLLETNPWGKSDPCLFKSYDKLDGSMLVEIGMPLDLSGK